MRCASLAAMFESPIRPILESAHPGLRSTGIRVAYRGWHSKLRVATRIRHTISPAQQRWDSIITGALSLQCRRSFCGLVTGCNANSVHRTHPAEPTPATLSISPWWACFSLWGIFRWICAGSWLRRCSASRSLATLYSASLVHRPGQQVR